MTADHSPPPSMRLEEADGGVAEATAKRIEAELLAALRRRRPQAVNERIVLTALRGEGELVGGLEASTSYGWLLIKTLWVAPQARRAGLGRSLVMRAEEKACALGCHGAWLDTSSEAAKAFYVALGYMAFAALENGRDQHPAGHQRWFMKKALSRGAA
ncbi:MAG: GNAT family N-acetyltransferase [Caulobacterales bacterium]|nr:GNAT family N-acetyltransferase [Caulobacterales bacterium]